MKRFCRGNQYVNVESKNLTNKGHRNIYRQDPRKISIKEES